MLKIAAFLTLGLTACSSLPDANMNNAAAYCAEIQVTGRFTATDAQGRYLGVSDSSLLAGATMADVIQLIDRLCVD